MPIRVTFLEQDRQDPATIAALLAEFLGAATRSLHVAIYDCRLSDGLAAPVVRALRERAAAGVEVKIVYDAGKVGVRPYVAGADPAPPGTADFFRRHLDGTGIAVKPITGGDPVQPRLMHHKYVVRDAGTPAAALWTGSANWTDDSWRIQENNILQIDSPDLCRFYEADFAELWQRGDIARTGWRDTGTVMADGKRVHVAFSPGEGRDIDQDIAWHVRHARRRLKLCSMLLNAGGILRACADVLAQGTLTDTGGLYDRTQMESVLDQWRG